LVSEPGDGGAEDGAGAVGGGVFGVGGGDPAPLLGQAEPAFDDVAAGVGGLVQAWRAASAGAFALAGGNLIGFLRAHRLHTPGGEHSPSLARGVGLIADHRVWPDPRPSRAAAGDSDLVEDAGEHGPVVALTAGEHYRQRHPTAID